PTVLPHRRLRLAPDRAGQGARGTGLLRSGRQPREARVRPRARPSLGLQGRHDVSHREIASGAARAGRRAGSPRMKRLTETAVPRLCDEPDAARISESYEGRTAVYEVDVPEADRGRLIGREGRTIRALRAFVSAAAAARGKRVVIRVRD